MKYTIMVFLLLLPAGIYAQNNLIFYGGSGDGAGSQAYLQSSLATNNGGYGDGHTMDTDMPSIASYNTGGNGDGWHVATHLQATITAHTGGAGDGWHTGRYFMQDTSANKGGAGDGWNFNKNIPFLSAYNKGGAGDGWASTYHPLAPLPLAFLSFEAKRRNETAMLFWELADDKDITSFDVERSKEAVNFSGIGNVPQQQSANKHYIFDDEKPLAGHNYYRLKVWKRDGSFEFTGTRLVVFEQSVAGSLIVYPNPASGTVQIKLPENWNEQEPLALNVYNAEGKLVLHQKYAGGKKLSLDIIQLAAGHYYIHIQTNSSSATARFEVLR